MSSPNSARKGFSALLGRFFGSDSNVAAPAVPEPAPPVRRFPKAPAPIVPPSPQVLTPRKGVGTVLRKAVRPGDVPGREPDADALWAAQAEAEEPARPAKPASRLLNLPRTVLSMLRKPAPPAKPIEFAKDAPPTHDPAFTRRKERDYPII